jgi:hypothetical protein
MKHGALFQQAHELIHVLRILDSHCAFCAAQTRARSVNRQLSLVPGARQRSLFHPPWRGRPPQRMRSLRQHGKPMLRAAHGGGGGGEEHSTTTSCGNDKLCDVILEEISRVRQGRLAGQRTRRPVRGERRCGRSAGTARQPLAPLSHTAHPLAPGTTDGPDRPSLDPFTYTKVFFGYVIVVIRAQALRFSCGVIHVKKC